MFAVRDAGAGTLIVSVDGIDYDSRDYSGALGEIHSAFAATGQTVSRTYRIRASGAPVEVRGLVRLGITASDAGNGRRRLRTMRAAHGGWKFDSLAPIR